MPATAEVQVLRSTLFHSCYIVSIFLITHLIFLYAKICLQRLENIANKKYVAVVNSRQSTTNSDAITEKFLLKKYLFWYANLADFNASKQLLWEGEAGFWVKVRNTKVGTQGWRRGVA